MLPQQLSQGGRPAPCLHLRAACGSWRACLWHLRASTADCRLAAPLPAARRSRGRRSAGCTRATAVAAEPVVEDRWIARTLQAFADAHGGPAPSGLAAVQQECLAALRTQRMPTQKVEEYRFTDLTPLIRQDSMQASSGDEAAAAQAESHPLADAPAWRLVLVDGVVVPQLSRTAGLPQGVYIGPLAQAPQEVAQHLGEQAREAGSAFAMLNGATARDVAVLAVPPGVCLDRPLHVLYLASAGSRGGALGVASPRLLAVVGRDAQAELVEEFAPAASAAAPAGGAYLTNAVAEVVLGQGARLRHALVQLEARPAFHVRATLVRQAERSAYALTEAAVGAALARHDLRVTQDGADTETEMRSFLVCGEGQLHDLHSRLRLSHPRGNADQLHKCIVASASGRGVFDGNVKVERAAQQTDARQLSRNLLLVPRAAVHVKPNLQIVADDVKCTHGCAVSDLEPDQLFYFRARGIDAEAARQALVYSFGAEVTQGLRHPLLLDRVEAAVNSTLATAAAARRDK